MGRLNGKVALVTGGARGMGAAEVRLFAKEGARVLFTDVRDDAGEHLAEELGDAAVYRHHDVTDEAGWADTVAAAEERFGRVDILVGNAGIGIPPKPLESTPYAEHQQTLDVNLNGVWLGMRAVAPAMRRAGGGSIVNISSIDGLAGVAQMSSYTASKFAVTGMTRAAALELGGDGIRVNSVHPGVISSEMVADAPPDVLARLQQVLDRQALPRMGTPEEVAMLVLFLASDESSYCTGGQFLIDGGHLAGPYRDHG